MTFETISKKEIKTLSGEFFCQMRTSRINFQQALSLKLKEKKIARYSLDKETRVV